ncbi:hypothetical protein [Rubinisphaera sp. JC750]|uniref:hypothetical protein n=1 Tax=Rubinisphaera sp. JC750 TaxID=2898658 RepID=UPI001F167D1B|nr:hypothetical protein [Rubinisphaera sp. JC750]
MLAERTGKFNLVENAVRFGERFVSKFLLAKQLSQLEQLAIAQAIEITMLGLRFIGGGSGCGCAAEDRAAEDCAADKKKQAATQTPAPGLKRANEVSQLLRGAADRSPSDYSAAEAETAGVLLRHRSIWRTACRKR